MLYKTVTFRVICSGPGLVYFQQSAYVQRNIGRQLCTLITVKLDQGKNFFYNLVGTVTRMYSLSEGISGRGPTMSTDTTCMG